MSKKDKADRTTTAILDTPPAAVAEPKDMDRAAMLKVLANEDPGLDYTELSDDELREFVVNARSQPGRENTAVESAVPIAEEDQPEDEEPAEDQQPAEDEQPVEQAASPAVEEPPVKEPASEPSTQQPEESVIQVPQDATREQLMAAVNSLKEELEKIRARGTSKKPKSGSKARPNVTYKLLDWTPRWHSTPQVAQLQQILFTPEVLEKYAVPANDKGVKAEIAEPELFALIEAGKEKGTLRTKQDPVRILQYYRTELLNANCLRWE